MTPARHIGSMIPWACSYDRDGKRFAITLYAVDPDQLLRDHGATLPGLCVDGELIATAPWGPEEGGPA